MYGSLTGDLFAIGLFLAFQGCGVCVSLRLLQRESAGARLLLGSVLGSVMLQWLPVPFAFLMGFTLPAHFCGLAAGLVCAAVCLWRGPGSLRGAAGALARHKGLWLAVMLWGFFCFLVWKSFLFEDGRIFSSQATYGDMSMHLSYITSMARQGTFPPEYSLLPGVRLSYPFLSDSISSSLYLCSASLKFAYFLPMAAAGGQVFFGFYLFALRVLKTEGRAVLAFILFFFNGGLGIFWFLGSRENFSRIFTAFYETPTNLIGENIRWVNTVVDMMLPQRATLFGWAVLFGALYLLYRAAFEGERWDFLYGGVLSGLLPMINTHCFLGLALVCLSWLLGMFMTGKAAWAVKGLVILSLPGMALVQLILVKTRKTEAAGLLWFAAVVLGMMAFAALALVVKSALKEGFRPWLTGWGALLLTAAVLALPQLFIWTFRQVGDGFVRGHFGWVAGEDGWLWFYFKNLGLGGVLALLGLIFAGKKTLAKYLPALPLWFVAQFVVFQPNEYDNNKLLYIGFVFLCFGAADFTVSALERLRAKPVKWVLGAGSLAVLISAAAPTMGREVVSKYELFGEGAIALCNFAEENVSADAVILTDTRHNNELASLAGRNVVCGSPAYLFYHGLPYYENERAARAMFEDPAGSAELFERFDVDYILVSDFERSSYNVDEAAIAARYGKVFDDGCRVLYQVKKGEDQ